MKSLLIGASFDMLVSESITCPDAYRVRYCAVFGAIAAAEKFVAGGAEERFSQGKGFETKKAARVSPCNLWWPAVGPASLR
jgi:hypothetical protein